MAFCWLGPAVMFIIGISNLRRTFSLVALFAATAHFLFYVFYNLSGYLYQFNRATELAKLPRTQIVGEHFSKLVSFGQISEYETMVIFVKHGIKEVMVINDMDGAKTDEHVGVVQTLEASSDCKKGAENQAQDLEDFFYPPAVPRVHIISSEEAKKMFAPTHSSSCAKRSTPSKVKVPPNSSTLYLYQGTATRYGSKFGITERQYELYIWRNSEMTLVDYRDDARPHYIFPFCVPLMEGVCDANRSIDYAKSAILQFLDNNLVKRAHHVAVFS